MKVNTIFLLNEHIVVFLSRNYSVPGLVLSTLLVSTLLMLTKPKEVDTLIISLLQNGKLRHRGV